jgi:hypothetical protein
MNLHLQMNLKTTNIMSKKSSDLIYWVLTGIVALVFIGSASGKFFANEEALKMAASFGLDAKTNTILGIVELISFDNPKLIADPSKFMNWLFSKVEFSSVLNIGEFIVLFEPKK